MTCENGPRTERIYNFYDSCRPIIYRYSNGAEVANWVSYSDFNPKKPLWSPWLIHNFLQRCKGQRNPWNGMTMSLTYQYFCVSSHTRSVRILIPKTLYDNGWQWQWSLCMVSSRDKRARRTTWYYTVFTLFIIIYYSFYKKIQTKLTVAAQ